MYEYHSLEGAEQDFELIKWTFEYVDIKEYKLSSGLGIEGFNGCRSAYSPEVGDYQNCGDFVLFDNLIIQTSGFVDGQVITLEDWERAVTLTHERLLIENE